MATIAKNQTAKSTAVNMVAEMGDYQGMPTFSVGEEGAHGKSKLSHTLGKWAKVLTIDPDGDSNLMNLFLAIHGNAEGHNQAEAAVRGMLAAFTQFQAWYLERFGATEAARQPEAETEPEEQHLQQEAQEPEPIVAPMPNSVECIRWTKRLSNETRIWAKASKAEREALILDAHQMAASGMPWADYKSALDQYSAAEYIAAVS